MPAPEGGAVDAASPVEGGADAHLAGSDAGPSPHPRPEPHGCIDDVDAGMRSVPCGHLSFELSVPERCLTEACGLVLDVHGGTMSGPMQEKNTGIARRGRARGYVVIQPSAVAHEGFGLLPEWVPELDDAQVLAFVEDVQQAFHTDPGRSHATGFSQGGFMAWRFACEHPDVFASVAPGGAAKPLHGDDMPEQGLGCFQSATDRPARELPILFMHGTRDLISSFAEAEVLRERVRDAFEMDAGTVLRTDAELVHTRFTNPRGVVFEFIEHDYVVADEPWKPFGYELAGHCYPGSEDWQATLPGQITPFGCTPPNAFHWGETVLDFFDAHPRQR